MGIVIISDSEKRIACFGCSVSDTVFGPIIYGDKKLNRDAPEMAEYFLAYLKAHGLSDPRQVHDTLDSYYSGLLTSIENGDRLCEGEKCGQWVKDLDGHTCFDCRLAFCKDCSPIRECRASICHSCWDEHVEVGECRDCISELKEAAAEANRDARRELRNGL